MMEKLDYKKKYKELYWPKPEPMLIEVPPIRFIMVDGEEITGCPRGWSLAAPFSPLWRDGWPSPGPPGRPEAVL
ncbi:hypothetical protein DJ90_3347 [Paenibacillus macerans]|uniref:Uncharacterized protein n=1 Tax=Paenibacillus macerans TaxID=44252 RepID=A0A090ZV47_PAEMA|nr:hypothetical protein DJ90_3347 [Paenibacillus macerans]